MCSFKQFNQGSFCCSSRISLSLASMRLTILQQCFFGVSRWSIISVNILFVSMRNPAISFWRRLCRIMIDSVCLRGIFWKCLKRADAITMRLILILEECAARRGSCGDWVLGPLFVITSHLNGGAMPGQHQTAVGILNRPSGFRLHSFLGHHQLAQRQCDERFSTPRVVERFFIVRLHVVVIAKGLDAVDPGRL